METAKTFIEYKGKRYSFYRTIRGQWEFENAGFSVRDIASGKLDPQLRFIYLQMKDCAKREGMPITDDFDDFLEAINFDIIEVFDRLYKEQNRINGLTLKEKKQEGKN